MHPPLGPGEGVGPGAGAHFVTEYALVPVHFLTGPVGAPLKFIHVPTV